MLDTASTGTDGVADGLDGPTKAALVTGRDVWRTAGAPGVRPLTFANGPHGVRAKADDADRLGLDWTSAAPATCFPAGAAMAATWDTELVRRVGAAIGAEARALGVDVLLGPGVNIKRLPQCGRNFEYASEDPVVAGEIGAAFVRGVQSRGVAASLKHFAVNNQESDRMTVSADVDERTLREIYLAPFERVVRSADPWTVMCSYNRINGVHAAQHHWLLTTVLREEWGYDGVVVSDWGAAHDLAAALGAGLDLQMPHGGPFAAAQVVQALDDGVLAPSRLDGAVDRIAALGRRTEPATEDAEDAGDVDWEAHHALAAEVAARACTLLKNDEPDGTPALPLPQDAPGLLVVGELARTAVIQGSGSSRVRPRRTGTYLDAFADALGRPVPFEPGYTVRDDGLPEDGGLLADGRAPHGDELRSAAAAAAARASAVVVLVGSTPGLETEGHDRPGIELPADQVALVRAVTEVNDHVVVVLASGGVVTTHGWGDGAAAILQAWLPGQAGPAAVVDVLLGRREPAGRLAETIPRRLAQTPAFGSYPAQAQHARYGEGIFVGYRWYDLRESEVDYPFGHGLTYTSFAYDRLSLEVVEGDVEVTVVVRNVGARRGTEVVQLYVRDHEAALPRPPRELKAFRLADLEPGESRTLTARLTPRDLSYWHPGVGDWVLEPGAFSVDVGASSRDIRLSADVTARGPELRVPLTPETPLTTCLADPVLGPSIADALRPFQGEDGPLDAQMMAMCEAMPIHAVVGFGLWPPQSPSLDDLLGRQQRTAPAPVELVVTAPGGAPGLGGARDESRPIS